MSSIKAKKSNRKSSGLMWVLPLFVIAFVYYLGMMVLDFHSLCVFKNTTGLPCPGCGMTRAVWSVLNGEYWMAFQWHPLWPMVVVGGIFVTYRVFAHMSWVPPIQWVDRLIGSNRFWVGILLLFVMVYLIRMGLYFPSQAPLDYEMNNVMVRLWEWIQGMF